MPRRSPRAAAAVLAAALPSASTAAIFNDVLPGARPMGMGYAYTSVADDPYALWFNPAGLAGSEHTQMGASLGRMLSPIGPLSFFALTYTRPFPPRPGSTVGAAFFDERQNNGGDKDEFLLHFSESFRVPELEGVRVTRPVKVGGNFKIVNVDAEKKRTGLGIDMGALVESNFGLRGGLSVTNLATDLAVPNPSLNMGLSYLWGGWLLLASDMRVRSDLTEYYPGLEASLLQGLLKLRVGKGVPLDGVKQVSFGIGVNYSPVLLDFGMTVPFGGFNRQGGAYQVSFNYKFGAPPFYGRYVGSSARKAEELANEVLLLEERRKSLASETATAEANRDGAVETQKAAEHRLRELQDQVRQAETRLDEKRYELEKPKPEAPPEAPPRPKRPRVEPFPRRHRVSPGDTLRSIAARHYGDPSLWETIYDANRDKVERGLPQDGAVFVIPPPPQR